MSDNVLALHAQINALREQLGYFVSESYEWMNPHDPMIGDIHDTLDASPEQCLADHNAKVAKAAYSQGYDAGFSDCRRDPFAHTGGIRAYNYAKTIR